LLRSMVFKKLPACYLDMAVLPERCLIPSDHYPIGHRLIGWVFCLRHGQERVNLAQIMLI
jgi:hypothetical protein